jgi:hypothetical protein
MAKEDNRYSHGSDHRSDGEYSEVLIVTRPKVSRKVLRIFLRVLLRTGDEGRRQ